MYGTVAFMKVKPGKLDELMALTQEETRDRRMRGFVADYVYRMDDDPDRLCLVVLFSDKESYVKNAQDPEQDKWYRRIRELLEADPEWHDGEVIQHTQA